MGLEPDLDNLDSDSDKTKPAEVVDDQTKGSPKPDDVATDTKEEPTEVVVEMDDGETVTIEQINEWKGKAEDYTKKSTANADERRNLDALKMLLDDKKAELDRKLEEVDTIKNTPKKSEVNPEDYDTEAEYNVAVLTDTVANLSSQIESNSKDAKLRSEKDVSDRFIADVDVKIDSDEVLGANEWTKQMAHSRVFELGAENPNRSVAEIIAEVSADFKKHIPVGGDDKIDTENKGGKKVPPSLKGKSVATTTEVKEPETFEEAGDIVEKVLAEYDEEK